MENISEVSLNKFSLFVYDNDWVGSTIIRDLFWEPHIEKFLKVNLSKDDVFLDAGSNYGYHSIVSSLLCKKVYSFEPQKKLFDIQNLTIEKNKISNIQTFNCALGNKIETSQMLFIDYDKSCNFGDLSIGEGGAEINIVTIDSLNIERLDVVKIDVQGYEKFVIQGGLEIISKCKPSFIIEFEDHHLRKFSYSSEELIKFMMELGYFPYLLQYLYPSDIVFIHESKLVNFIERNNIYISNLKENNNVNFCLDYGVTKKIVYDNWEIISNFVVN